jgi:Helix-turn-helix domain
MLTQERLIVATTAEIRNLIREELSDADKKQRTVERTPDPQSEWISNRNTLKEFDWSRATLQRHRASGRLPFSKVGQSIFYRRDDLNSLLEQNFRRQTADR